MVNKHGAGGILQWALLTVFLVIPGHWSTVFHDISNSLKYNYSNSLKHSISWLFEFIEVQYYMVISIHWSTVFHDISSWNYVISAKSGELYIYMSIMVLLCDTTNVCRRVSKNIKYLYKLWFNYWMDLCPISPFTNFFQEVVYCRCVKMHLYERKS